MSFQEAETARDHIQNARAILAVYREKIERGMWENSPTIVCRTLRDAETRLERALEQLDRGNI